MCTDGAKRRQLQNLPCYFSTSKATAALADDFFQADYFALCGNKSIFHLTGSIGREMGDCIPDQPDMQAACEQTHAGQAHTIFRENAVNDAFGDAEALQDAVGFGY